MKLLLTIEPIPASAWGKSLASLLPRKEWDEIRTKCYREAGYKCEICGNSIGDLEAHEVWGFDDRKNIMFLKFIICLCELCHGVKHIGRSMVVNGKRYFKILIQHWCSVNGKTEKDFEAYQAEIMEQNRKRANKFYQVRVGKRILT